MAVKYHISKDTGRPNICRASLKECPVGGPKEHFNSKEEAREYYEKKNSHQVVKSLSKKKKDSPKPSKKKTENEIPLDESALVAEDFTTETDSFDEIDFNPDHVEVEDISVDDVLYNDILNDTYDNEEEDEVGATDGYDDEVCDQCGDEKNDVRMRIDPYDQSQGITTWRPLCDNCFEDLQSY